MRLLFLRRFSYAALRGKDQEERRERERFERDGQTDENEVKNHGRLGLLGEAVHILSCQMSRISRVRRPGDKRRVPGRYMRITFAVSAGFCRVPAGLRTGC